MDEQQMNGYLQHTPTIIKMQSRAVASEIAHILVKLLPK